MSESPLGFHVASSSYIEHASIPNYNCNVISSKGVNSVKCCLVLLVTISQLNNDNKSWLETQRFSDCTRSPTEFLNDNCFFHLLSWFLKQCLCLSTFVNSLKSVGEKCSIKL